MDCSRALSPRTVCKFAFLLAGLNLPSFVIVSRTCSSASLSAASLPLLASQLHFRHLKYNLSAPSCTQVQFAACLVALSALPWPEASSGAPGLPRRKGEELHRQFTTLPVRPLGREPRDSRRQKEVIATGAQPARPAAYLAAIDNAPVNSADATTKAKPKSLQLIPSQGDLKAAIRKHTSAQTRKRSEIVMFTVNAPSCADSPLLCAVLLHAVAVPRTYGVRAGSYPQAGLR